MRDQSILIKQLVDSAKDRLLLTTYTFYKGQFIEDAGGLMAMGGAKEGGQGLRAIQTEAFQDS